MIAITGHSAAPAESGAHRSCWVLLMASLNVSSLAPPLRRHHLTASEVPLLTPILPARPSQMSPGHAPNSLASRQQRQQQRRLEPPMRTPSLPKRPGGKDRRSSTSTHTTPPRQASPAAASVFHFAQEDPRRHAARTPQRVHWRAGWSFANIPHPIHRDFNLSLPPVPNPFPCLASRASYSPGPGPSSPAACRRTCKTTLSFRTGGCKSQPHHGAVKSTRRSARDF